jgi:DNA-binding protein H-NS
LTENLIEENKEQKHNAESDMNSIKADVQQLQSQIKKVGSNANDGAGGLTPMRRQSTIGADKGGGFSKAME